LELNRETRPTNNTEVFMKKRARKTRRKTRKIKRKTNSGKTTGWKVPSGFVLASKSSIKELKKTADHLKKAVVCARRSFIMQETAMRRLGR
jgi:hypothetical protein